MANNVDFHSFTPHPMNFRPNEEPRRLKKSYASEVNDLKVTVSGPSHQELANANKVSSQFNTYFPIPPFIPEVERLSFRELEEMNKNEDVLNQFVDELPQASAFTQEVDVLMGSIKHLSISISKKKLMLDEQRQTLVESYGSLNILKQQWDTLNKQHQSVSQRYLPENIEAGLKEAATSLEEESEEIAEEFLSGRMEVDKFLSSYSAKRMASHARKTKEEVLHKQLQELQRHRY